MEQPTRKCSDCREVKPLKKFYRNKNSAGGRLPFCAECHKRRYQKEGKPRVCPDCGGEAGPPGGEPGLRCLPCYRERKAAFSRARYARTTGKRNKRLAAKNMLEMYRSWPEKTFENRVAMMPWGCDSSWLEDVA